ncbi:MAG: alpha/beta fold hydrolase [Herpetosiphonaceae bacterium]|nr:alpha/beta fold hydrolase [Herpetosiphonaceae bacterium]
MSRKIVGASLGAGVAGALAGVAAYAARQISGPTRAERRDLTFTFTPFETGVDYEAIEFTTSDGLRISGWWLPRPDSKQVVIGCHGHRGSKHELLGIGSGLWRAGMNVLLFDFRGRGASANSICSLAYHEVADLLGAVSYATARRPDATIGVIGYSMGAAVSLLAAAIEPRIRRVVADSSFAVMRDVVTHAVNRRRLPSRAVVAIADRVTGHRYGYRFDSVRPVDVIAQIGPRPVMLIHGTNDTMIPVRHAYHLYNAASSPKELWIVTGVAHCGAYFLDRAQYVQRIASFMAAES